VTALFAGGNYRVTVSFAKDAFWLDITYSKFLYTKDLLE